MKNIKIICVIGAFAFVAILPFVTHCTKTVTPLRPFSEYSHPDKVYKKINR